MKQVIILLMSLCMAAPIFGALDLSIQQARVLDVVVGGLEKKISVGQLEAMIVREGVSSKNKIQGHLVLGKHYYSLLDFDHLAVEHFEWVVRHPDSPHAMRHEVQKLLFIINPNKKTYID